MKTMQICMINCALRVHECVKLSIVIEIIDAIELNASIFKTFDNLEFIHTMSKKCMFRESRIRC